MFKKKFDVYRAFRNHCGILLIIFQVKPLAPLRSSDRRKVADSIIQQFHIEIPEVEAVQENGADQEQTSGVSGIGALRNSLLPEGSMSARVMTTYGPDQSLASGTIYVGSRPDDEQRILWLKLDYGLYPTGLSNLLIKEKLLNMTSVYFMATSQSDTTTAYDRKRCDEDAGRLGFDDTRTCWPTFSSQGNKR